MPRKRWVLVELNSQYGEEDYEVIAVTANEEVAIAFERDRKTPCKRSNHDMREAHEVLMISRWPL